jgi:hypothetical protein
MSTHNEILRSRLQMAAERGFVLKPHHYLGRDRKTGDMFGYESIIFDHDFARAIWGDEPDWYDESRTSWRSGWEGRLMDMAIANDRLTYLEAHT